MRKNVTKKQLAAYENVDATASAYTIGGMILGGMAGAALRPRLCGTSTSSICVDGTGQPSSVPFWIGAGLGGLAGFLLLYATAK